MKIFNAVILLFFLTFSAFAQDNKVKEIVQEGIKYHDSGNYTKAIDTYKKALAIAPKSGLVNYEIALSYFTSGQYKQAVSYSKAAISAKDGHELVAYVCYGSSLDLLGNSKKAIKVYEKALKDYENYLLYYNLALTSYNTGLLDKAYDAAVSAITANPSHGSSHLVLSKVMADKGSRVKAVLPLYYFLLLEPNSPRSAAEYQNLRTYLAQGVSKKSEKEINVTISSSGDSDFGAADLMIGLSMASNNMEENKEKTDLELFAKNNETIFSVLGELQKDKTGFWWDVYVTMFYGIQTEGYTEAYSYYISQSQGEPAINWLETNEEQLESFIKWINGE